MYLDGPDKLSIPIDTALRIDPLQEIGPDHQIFQMVHSQAYGVNTVRPASMGLGWNETYN